MSRDDPRNLWRRERAELAYPPFTCRRYSEERLSRSRWRGIRCAGCFLLAFGAAIAAQSGPAGAEGGQKNDWNPPPDSEPQRLPIVDGHHIQPRPSDFNHPEFTPSESMTVDDLYVQIKRMQAGEAAEATRVLRGGRD